MILGFHDRFVPYVLDGSKTHTIRSGERWKVGMRADLFAEPRRPKKYEKFCPATERKWVDCGCTKCGSAADAPVRQVSGMRLLFRAPVVRVEEIEIFEYEAIQRGFGPISPLGGNHCLNAHRGPSGESLLVRIEGEGLAVDEARAFFYRDGFRAPGECPQYQALGFWKARLPFKGQIIHWDVAQRYAEKNERES